MDKYFKDKKGIKYKEQEVSVLKKYYFKQKYQKLL